MMRGSGFLTGRGCNAVRAALACAVLQLAGTASAAAAQPAQPTESAQSTQRITPNFKDADITQIAEAVSAATGKLHH